MPQTPYDPLAGILAKSPIPNAARADAWDAFHDASDEHDLASRLRALSLPDSVKADLWDLKAGHDTRTPASGADFAPTALPYKGQTMPGDTFAEKLRNAASVLGGEVVGGLKGAAHSALGVGQMAVDAGLVPGTTPSGFNPAFRNPLIQRAEADTAYNDDPAQRFGGYLETAAELAAPAVEATRAGVALAQAAPAAARAIPAALGKTGTMAADIASHLPVVGRPIRLLRSVLDFAASKEAPKAANAGGRLVKDAVDRTPALERELADALEALRKPDLPQSVELPPPAELPPGYTPRTDVPAPAAPSPNAGGRVVPPQTPTVEQVVSDALTDARAPEPPARITTPPAPTLPPGYTPRATVPKPKAVKMAAPEPPAPATPPKRAYFLKPVEELQAAGPVRVEPTDITPDTLPEAWKSRVGQDIFPTTGADGKEVLDAFRQEMQARGLSLGQAITLVSKNKALPTSVRAQLLRALSKSKAN